MFVLYLFMFIYRDYMINILCGIRLCLIIKYYRQKYLFNALCYILY